MFSIDDIDLSIDEATDNFTSTESATVSNSNSLAQGKKLFRRPNRIVGQHAVETPTKEHEQPPLLSPPSSPVTSIRRKFPGPAGLLPDKPPRSFNDSSAALELAEENRHDLSEQPVLCSQSSEHMFTEPPFKKLKKDLNMNSADSPLNTYTISWVKKRTANKSLRGRKIPFLAVIVQNVDCSSADPVVTLRDPTGELCGVLHREVWKDMGNKLRTGAAIILKQVGVLSTGMSRRQIIINITMNNIVTIYCPSDNGEDVIVNPVQPTTSDDLAKSIREWQTQAQAQIQSPTPPSPSLFDNVSKDRQKLFQTVSSNKLMPDLPTRVLSKSFRPHRLSAPEKNQRQDNTSDNSIANFDLFTDDLDIDLVDSSSTRDHSPSKENNFRNSVLEQSALKPVTSHVVLSQAENMMLSQVLDGVDLDDFE